VWSRGPQGTSHRGLAVTSKGRAYGGIEVDNLDQSSYNEITLGHVLPDEEGGDSSMSL
jgi:hypothetical protein